MSKYEITFQDGSSRIIEANHYENKHGFVTFFHTEEKKSNPDEKEITVGTVNSQAMKGLYLIAD